MAVTLAGNAGAVDGISPRLPALVEAATFTRMRADAERTAPDERLGQFADRSRFFRSGSSGQWRSVLTDADLRHHERRLAGLATPDLIAWLPDGGAPELCTPNCVL